MDLMAKTTLESHFFTQLNYFVRVLLYNVNNVGNNVHINTVLYLHFSQNKLKYFVVTDMKQMLI